MTSLHDELEKKLQDPNATPMSLPLQFLKAITRDFSTESELGRGGYGVVYKGVLQSGKIIAVKRLLEVHLVDDKTFQNEVGNLMDIKHQHVVRFIGYCAESSWELIDQPSGRSIWAETPKRLLCFEYVCNSLDKHISDQSSVFEWNMRYNTIKGICSGLNFLHEEWHIVHLDLKPENILMDVTMIPKIADFGLSRIFGDQQSRIITANCVGSRGYMAPEYINRGIISMKADIFSLGVIIIEIVTGRRDYPYLQLDNPVNIAASCQHFMEEVLGSWRYKFESTEKYKLTEIYIQQVQECIAIALKCVDPVMEKRPTVKDVIQVLNAVDQVTPGSSVLLDVYPLELSFQFEPNKLIACSLDLRNNTDEQVAFGLLSDGQRCFLGRLPMFGIVDPGTTCTLVVIMNERENLPRERNFDLILQTSTSTYYGIHTERDNCMQHFENAEELGNTVHEVILKGVCALQGEMIFESLIPLSIKIISLEHYYPIISIDANQTEPLIMICYIHGNVVIENYDTQKSMGSITLPKGDYASCAKFIARKGWFLVGSSNGFIHVYNYKKEMRKITSFTAHSDYISSVAIHPTGSYVLSASNTTGIKLWDWDQGWFGWKCIRTFNEHWSIVLAVAFNPKDYNSFASASRDGAVKVWNLDSSTSKYTLSGHLKAVNCLDFFTRGDGQLYLITGSDDNTAKIWDMQKKKCVRTLPHRSHVLSLLPHPKLPVLVTCTEDGHVYLWSSMNFRLKRILKFGGLSLVSPACLMETGRIAVAHSDKMSVIEIREEEGQGSSNGNDLNSISATD